MIMETGGRMSLKSILGYFQSNARFKKQTICARKALQNACLLNLICTVHTV